MWIGTIANIKSKTIQVVANDEKLATIKELNHLLEAYLSEGPADKDPSVAFAEYQNSVSALPESRALIVSLDFLRIRGVGLQFDGQECNCAEDGQLAEHPSITADKEALKNADNTSVGEPGETAEQVSAKFGETGKQEAAKQEIAEKAQSQADPDVASKGPKGKKQEAPKEFI